MELHKIPSSVAIMAVTKGVSIDNILLVLKEKNIVLIGESRWQEAKDKLPHFPPTVEKHFIGHIQTNKADDVVAHFDCIESVDSVRLAKAINIAAEKNNTIMPIFLQINISNDPNKHGFAVTDIPAVLEHVSYLSNLKVSGLMTITADDQTIEQTRSDYRRMKRLQVQYRLSELSMGMSHDWEIAVEEGATIVRLGRALFQMS